MGRSPCCDKVGLKKGPWTPDEDQKLLAFIDEHGHGSWRALPVKAGLQRCGKSCRLRWTNYLRPDIKRGKFSLQEEQAIIQLHALLGNRWSAIATHLPQRTDNEIKNYWNTHLKKRLAKLGIDPITHKPKNNALLISTSHCSKSGTSSAADLSHMAQWESARLEAEARLVRESQLRNSLPNNIPNPSFRSLDILKARNINVNHKGEWSRSSTDGNIGGPVSAAIINGQLGADLESPKSTLTFSDHQTNSTNVAPSMMIEFVGSTNSGSNSENMNEVMKEEGDDPEVQDWDKLGFGNLSSNPVLDDDRDHEQDDQDNEFKESNVEIEEDGFTNLLLNNYYNDHHDHYANSDHSLTPDGVGENGRIELEEGDGGRSSTSHDDHGKDRHEHYHEENQNYWNSILNLVNSSPSDSLLF